MLSLLTLGFLYGIAHAFEADHLAAVSALVTGRSDRKAIIKRGALWGLGHTITLLLVGGTVLALNSAIPARIATELEMAVGVMLVGLGGHVLYRLRRDRLHFHRHSHGDGVEHLHLHSHRSDSKPHRAAQHRHTHPDPTAWRALIVGVMHGLAGSAALVLVTAATLQSPLAGIGYIALFGLGSILGMAGISTLIAVPMAYCARYLTRANLALQLAIGALTIAIGAHTIQHAASLLIS